MVVGPQGELPLPWLSEPLRAALPRLQAHATLLQGHSGDGALEFALAIAAAWLCETAAPGQPACGRCEGCRLLRGRQHPDLFLLMPEVLRREVGWPMAGDKADDGDGEDGKGKRKPSRQIRIDEVRAAIDWIVTTPARSPRKLLMLHPATALNLHAANALLKTLEEPPATARLLLTAAQPEHLLPTVRSRCQTVLLLPPSPTAALAWLQTQGLRDAQALLAAADGHPLLALQWSAAGLSSASWQAWPAAVLTGHAGSLGAGGTGLLLHALLCLCHDLQCRAAGAVPRYFSPEALAPIPGADMAELSAWQAELLQLARQQEHPWSEALLVEALLARARSALVPSAGRRAGSGTRAG